MYNGLVGGSTALGGAGLAVTGFNTMWSLVAGVTLVVAGMAVMRLAPKRRRVRS